jgi:hypothetical protein
MTKNIDKKAEEQKLQDLNSQVDKEVSRESDEKINSSDIQDKNNKNNGNINSTIETGADQVESSIEEAPKDRMKYVDSSIKKEAELNKEANQDTQNEEERAEENEEERAEEIEHESKLDQFKYEIEKRVHKICGYFSEEKEGAELKKASDVKKKKQVGIFGGAFGAIIVASLAVAVFLWDENAPDATKETKFDDFMKKSKTIELGGDATAEEQKWQSFLEDSIEDEVKERADQINLLKDTMEKTTIDQKAEADKEFSEIKYRLSYALGELERIKAENENMNGKIRNLTDGDTALKALELGITSIGDDISVGEPIASYNHIPATSYVSGHLLGGVVVSTSVSTASEPIPVIIKLTHHGNLPKDFAVDIKTCRLLASAYGDISSERAIIRAEELVCEDRASGLITTTKVAGVIYGDDGANGIRGAVVSMSDKHLKNAFIGGVLSGFASSANGKDSMDLSSLGIVSTKKKSAKDMAMGSLASGAGTAAEKLADYHIKLAENISPVILIPGGTKVDVMFTKSVEIGATDTRTRIKEDREN